MTTRSNPNVSELIRTGDVPLYHEWVERVGVGPDEKLREMFLDFWGMTVVDDLLDRGHREPAAFVRTWQRTFENFFAHQWINARIPEGTRDE